MERILNKTESEQKPMMTKIFGDLDSIHEYHSHYCQGVKCRTVRQEKVGKSD
jgi:hypothetical protein